MFFALLMLLVIFGSVGLLTCLLIVGATRCPRLPAPAVWVGWQPRVGGSPPVGLWNVTHDIPGHPRHSTVSTTTLEALGYCVVEPQ